MSENMSATMPINAREIAFKALGDYRRNSNSKPIELTYNLSEKHKLSTRDCAFSVRLTRGVLQNMLLCDYYISRFSTIKLKKLEPQVLDILRISVYELMFMTKIPENSTVNEAVSLVKKYSNIKASGFSNAVLRKIASAIENGNLPEIAPDSSDIHEHLSIKYSHPKWLVEQLCDNFGDKEAEALLSHNNETERPIFAQVNTLKVNLVSAENILKSENINTNRHPGLENCLTVSNTGSIAKLDAYKKGHIYIQDPASKLAVFVSGVKQGDHVFDGCAAPGGKSFASAIMMQNIGSVMAGDIRENKISLVSEGAKRLGINIIKAETMDASVFDRKFADSADVVFADVPCSGFGVIHKKPEIRYKSKDDICDLPDIQKKILSNLSKYVKPGKTLIYSTCTLLKSENEDVISWFLSQHSNFSPQEFSHEIFGNSQNGKITLLPHIHGTDGFFICKLARFF